MVLEDLLDAVVDALVNALAQRCSRICLGLICAGTLTGVCCAGERISPLDAGIHARGAGNIDDSVVLLEQAVASAPDRESRVRARTQLAMSLVQAGHLAQADTVAQAAYEESSGSARVLVALALGNIAAASHDTQRATLYYGQVLAAQDERPGVHDAQVAAELNLTRLQPPQARLSALQDLQQHVESITNDAHRAHALLSLATLAGETFATTAAEPALRISSGSLSKAADLAQQSGDGALQVEADDALAQLFETQGRLGEALRINRSALLLAGRLELGAVENLLVRLLWRDGRLRQQLGEQSLALASYLKAAQHLEAIRQDLPIVDESGQSTYQTLLKPIYVGLMDLMLEQTDALADAEQPARLTAVLDALELTHQAEMQDYLGDRCSVESVRAGGAPLEPGVAVIYTLVLGDRLEVILRTRDQVSHHAISIPAASLNAETAKFRGQLLDAGSSDYLATAQEFYRWMIEPFETRMAQSGIRELVIVPDGYLRLIPFAALHDGHQFLAQRYVISSVTGLTMTAASTAHGTRAISLLAGLSEPGPVVVDKLLSMGFTGEPDSGSSDRAVVIRARARAFEAQSGADASALRQQLMLPAVTTEIEELRPLGRNVALLNGDFTVARFQREVVTGRYGVIHIATHGFFGASARESFLLAYDNVIRMDDLQNLIADNGGQSADVELLTLSACDTATGDDRAPLGFAGAAIRARAHSVVGTLWAVSDEAAEQFMAVFYGQLAGHGKAEALTQAQRALIRWPRFSHPYFWAPIMLIGDWN